MLRQRAVTLVAVCRHKSSKANGSAQRPVSSAERIRPPHNIALKFGKTGRHTQHFNNEGNVSGMGPRLHDYQAIGDLVRSIPSAAERIDFVNPYERDWTRRERRFHRPWMHKLVSTRKAWAVRSVPVYFDSLNFYQYITKTKMIEEFSSCYTEDVRTPSASFMERLNETMRFHLDDTNVDNEGDRTTRILRSLLDMLIEYLVETRMYPDLTRMRISYAPRCESFWIRSGFQSLYDDEKCRFKIRGDHRAKLGELAFVLRDEFAAQVRTHEQLKPIVPLTDPIANGALFDRSINIANDVLFSPSIYGLFPDADPLWQCPGFEPDCGETNKYGLIAFKECTALNDRCKQWKVKGNDETIIRNECFRATAIASLFSWLNAQAHSIGHTQYNDIEQPLVSQLVLSDGKQFMFAVAQLNTLQINVEFEGLSNTRTNLCYVDGPLELYSRYDASARKFWHRSTEGNALVDGINPRVITTIMQMLVRDMSARISINDHADAITTFSSDYTTLSFDQLL